LKSREDRSKNIRRWRRSIMKGGSRWRERSNCKELRIRRGLFSWRLL